MPRLAPTTKPIDPSAIRGIRSHLSRAAFARIIGVTGCSVYLWERGGKQPSGPVSLLLHLIIRNPDLLTVLERLEVELSAVKPSIAKADAPPTPAEKGQV